LGQPAANVLYLVCRATADAPILGADAMPTKHFTLEAAEALLPRLSALIRETRLRKESLDREREKAWALSTRMKSNGHTTAGDVTAAPAAEAAASEMQSLIQQIADLGCELKDIDQGLVDFPALMDGREVYLCWKLGEPAIAWWHELDAGFAGRRPLARRT